MSVDTVREYFRQWDMQDKVMEFSVSSATVAQAALALGTKEQRIAKTMSFLVEEKPILIVIAGDAKVDNKKYKETFHKKAVMIKPDQLTEYVGHPMGGVCPFAVKEGTEVYLDMSLKRFETVFPACGSANSAIELTLQQLEECSGFKDWVDVSKLLES